MHIILVEPEIPQNTGNIARTCALTGTVLHLIRPLGFSLEDRYLKRAGLDYWHEVDVRVWESFIQVQEELNGHSFWFATTKAQQFYHQVCYQVQDVLVFGKETQGLPATMLDEHREQLIKIPMRPLGRSLNLANSVNIILYEALRQQNFSNL